MLSGSELPAVKRPPFMMEPAVPMAKEEGDEDEEKIVMIDLGSEKWIKDEEEMERSLSAQPLQQSESGLSAGAAAGIAIACTLVMVAAALAGFIVYKRRQHNNRIHGNEMAENNTRMRRSNQYGGAQM